MQGKIRRVLRDLGYRSILAEDGKDVFFHGNDLQQLVFEQLKEGNSVEFEVRSGPRGRPRAVNVCPVGPENRLTSE